MFNYFKINKMIKINSLDQIIKQYKEVVLNELRETTDLIFKSGIVDYIVSYEGFVDQLNTAARKGSLIYRLKDLTELFKKRNEKIQQKGIGSYISYKNATEYLREEDVKDGRKALSKSGYQFRIKRAIKKGEIRVKKKNKRTVGLYKEDINRLTGETYIRTERKEKNYFEGKFNKIKTLIKDKNYAFERAIKKLGISGREAQGYRLAISRWT